MAASEAEETAAAEHDGTDASGASEASGASGTSVASGQGLAEDVDLVGVVDAVEDAKAVEAAKAAETAMLADSAAEVLRRLIERGETMAAAESLTGGLVAAEVTAAPGASKAFKGSVTSYATEVKRDLLGVDGDLLADHGAVDAEVARQMAHGVRELLGTDWGVATTGVAGPERQDGQPVGTVFVAVAGPAATTGTDPGTGRSHRPEPDGRLDSSSSSALRSEGKVAALRLNGNRTEIRMESVRSVLELLLDQLSDEQTGNGRAQDTEQNGGT